MLTLFVVEVDKAFASGVQPHTIGGWIQIEVFVLQGAPEAFDEHVVDRTAFAVHADPYTFGRTAFAGQGRVSVAGELVRRTADRGSQAFRAR